MIGGEENEMDIYVPTGFRGDDYEDPEEKLERFMEEAAEYTSQFDQVSHPKHYTFGRFEVIDVLEDWFPTDPLLWQVGKYISRAAHKGDFVENLKKAQWYLQRRIDKEESNNA